MDKQQGTYCVHSKRALQPICRHLKQVIGVSQQNRAKLRGHSSTQRFSRTVRNAFSGMLRVALSCNMPAALTSKSTRPPPASRIAKAVTDADSSSAYSGLYATLHEGHASRLGVFVSDSELAMSERPVQTHLVSLPAASCSSERKPAAVEASGSRHVATTWPAVRSSNSRHISKPRPRLAPWMT